MVKVFVHIGPNYRYCDRLMIEMSQYLKHYPGFMLFKTSYTIITDDLIHKYVSNVVAYDRLQGLNIVGYECHECSIPYKLHEFIKSRIRE